MKVMQKNHQEMLNKLEGLDYGYKEKSQTS